MCFVVPFTALPNSQSSACCSESTNATCTGSVQSFRQSVFLKVNKTIITLRNANQRVITETRTDTQKKTEWLGTCTQATALALQLAQFPKFSWSSAAKAAAGCCKSLTSVICTLLQFRCPWNGLGKASSRGHLAAVTLTGWRRADPALSGQSHWPSCRPTEQTYGIPQWPRDGITWA